MLTTSKGIFKNSSHAFGCQLCWEVEEYHPITSEFHPLGGRDWRVIFLQDQPKERKVFSGVTRELKKEFIFGQGILRMVEAKILMIGFLYRWTVIGGVFILLVPTQTLCTLCVSSGFFFPFFFFFLFCSQTQTAKQNNTNKKKWVFVPCLLKWGDVGVNTQYPFLTFFFCDRLSIKRAWSQCCVILQRNAILWGALKTPVSSRWHLSVLYGISFLSNWKQGLSDH